MRCYWATVLSGRLILKEHEAAKWLGKEELDSVNWLPADRTIIRMIQNKWDELSKV
jgi:8-oxo-dGTP diphosphatase